MKPLYFHYKTLTVLGACDERHEFRKRFGNKVLVTVTNAVANARRFNWWWIAETTFTYDNLLAMRERVWAVNGRTDCDCNECDPSGAKRRFVAQCFAEIYLTQGGRAKRLHHDFGAPDFISEEPDA